MNLQLQSLFQQAIQAFQSGNFIKAEEVLQYFLNIKPTEFDALHLLGIVYASQNKHDTAIEWYKKALDIISDEPSALSNYASSLSAIGRNQEALNIFNKVLEINSSDPVFFYNIANTLCELDRYEEALSFYERSIQLDPQYFQAHNNYGKALYDLKRYSDSLIHYDYALLINPFFLDCLINKGVALNQLMRYDEALANYDHALTLKPDYAEGWSNKGNTLHELKRFDEALAHHNHALTLKPDYAEGWSNKGNTLHELKRFDEALAHYDHALTLKPDYAVASLNKSVTLLLQGYFEVGLPLYESRWDSEKASEMVRKRIFDKPTWLGVESLQDKTILLYGEQGLGDFIQFCRYVKLVANLGAKVILEVPQPLGRLMENVEGITELVIKGQELPLCDYQSPLLSLPLAFKTNLDTIPNPNRYINPDNYPNKMMEWKARLGSKLKPRIGLVWSGNPHHKNDHNRSILLRDILPFLPNQFEYVSLQKEVREADKLIFELNPQILSFACNLNDFLDTAALIDNLDLVISVDTSVAHLSGALGKRTLLLLPYVPDWRWLLDRDNSPWYPSMKLYRQTSIGDWNSVFDKVKLELSSSFS